jgi:hypothetical protein
MEFLDVNLIEDLSLLRNAIHSPFYWRIKKTYSSRLLEILTKKSAQQENSCLFMTSIL